MGILVETGPMFSHAQLHFMVFSTPSLGSFILNFATAISKVVKKAKPRSLGRAARNQYMRAKSLFWKALGTEGPWAGGRFFVIELCYCLGPFMDICIIS